MIKTFVSKHIISVLCVFAFMVVFGVTIAANIFAAFLTRTVEFNINQRMMVSANRAADLAPAEELDQYREIADMRKPSYRALRRKLRDFSENSGLLYVYYIRSVDGVLRYVIDNDFNEETRVGLDTPPAVMQPWIERALEGNTACSEPGRYSPGGEGLLSAYAPVFDREGKVAYIAGVDIRDREIVFARRMVTALTVVQVIAVAAMFASVLVFLLRFQAARDSSAPAARGMIRRKFLVFSGVFFLLLCAIGAVVFAAALRRSNEGKVEQNLSLAVDTMRLRLANAVNTELALVFKMADVPLIKRYLLDPANPALRELAFEEFAAYRRNFKNNSVFWISDRDKEFYFDDENHYFFDPAAPENYWYNMTLYETERYNFNINYNAEIKRTNLWVNAPVFHEGKPIGMAGTGIDLTEFIDSVYGDLGAGIELYLFNKSGEITVAKDRSLVFDKKLLIDHLGAFGASIIEESRVSRSRGEDIRIIKAGNTACAVGAIPLMDWYIAAFVSGAAASARDPVLTGFFAILVALVLVIFIVSNVFVASIQATVDAQQERLRELAEEALAASRAKSSFIASTSHEIRTPMNAIIGMSELALRESGVPQKDGYVREIQHAGHNLLAIINDILDFSKIESGKLDINCGEYALSSLLGDCVSIIRARLGEKDLRFVTEFDPALPNKVLGDEARVRQITLNLLSNAVKYTPTGTVTFTVRGENLSENRVNLIVKVADTGLGIKPEDLPKLFGEFNRLDGAKNRGVEGTGLGLAISRNLCRLMGGDITVESEYGAGSVFTARIPQTVTDSAPFTIEDRKQSAASLTFRFTAQDARILVVDDIPTNLTVASGLLAPYQMTIDTALSGEEAIELVQANRYDLILMDHMMPGMDGLEAAARIRALEGDYYKALPIIALTANAVSGMKEMFLEKGFNDYLAKPIDVAKLDETLARWIPRDKQRKADNTDGSLPPGPGIAGQSASPPLSGKPSAAPRSGGPLPAAPLVIPGVDVARGIALIGGKEAVYRKVLAMFCKDSGERLALLRNMLAQNSGPGPDDLPAFVIQAHSVKSLCASIGAAEISSKAAELEAAGKAADLPAIRERLPGFVEQLAELAQEIGKAIQ